MFHCLKGRAAVAAVALLAAIPAHAADREDLWAAAAAVQEEVVAWRRDIHEHPELSNREVRTAGLVADHLRSLGIEVETGVAHTGVVGTLVGGLPGPVVALRADMDALPVVEQTGLPFASTVRAEYNGEEVGVMHACGHDNHVAILMGAAEVLAGLRDRLPGTVKFVFQPAEEGPPEGEEGGASLMVKEGVLDGPAAPEAIFGLHVGPLPPGLYYKAEGAMAAADGLKITVEGRQTHGSSPWLGVDPITAAAQIVTALQTVPSRQMDLTTAPVVVSIGSIRGGVRGNIIPESVEMVGTIRTLDADMREAFHERIRRTAEKVAEASGARARVEIDAYAPVTWNDPELTRTMVPTLEWAAGGAERVHEMRPIMGAEDFSYFQERIPGLYVFLGVNREGVGAYEAPANHSPLFDANEDALIIGVRTMAGLAWDYLSAASD
ncbi:MAG: amidohydrolase [Thermoanaerobaculia bacterium]